MYGIKIILLFALLHQVFAAIELTDLKSSYDATDGIDITWKDDSDYPSLSDLGTLHISLCTGPNDDITCNIITKTIKADAKKADLDLSSVIDMGASGEYYLQFYSSIGYIMYSDRFKLSDMSGTVEPSGTGTPPADTYPDLGTSAMAASIAITYTLQTGPTRYAPMQTQPGSTVTRSLVPSRRYPTSAVTYFSTAMASPSQVSTVTTSWSYTFSQLTNYASHLSNPTGYYPASAALSSSMEAQSMKRKKRWVD